jgi:DNA-binding Lrp family transcriptional regulator
MSARPPTAAPPDAPEDALLDDADRRILDLIQTSFPLAPRPYAVIGAYCGLEEEEVFRRVRALSERGVIRRLGATFDSGRLGFSSCLCAAQVPADKLKAFTDEVNALAGVTHNYLRRHAYNVWFTCTAPSPEALRELTDGIQRRTGIAIVGFPAERVYKIKVDFRMLQSTTGAGRRLTPFRRRGTCRLASLKEGIT